MPIKQHKVARPLVILLFLLALLGFLMVMVHIQNQRKRVLQKMIISHIVHCMTNGKKAIHMNWRPILLFGKMKMEQFWKRI